VARSAGAVCSTSRSHVIDFREALLKSVRCAVIYKEASRRYKPPRRGSLRLSRHPALKRRGLLYTCSGLVAALPR
jgi:hypothetical protein